MSVSFYRFRAATSPPVERIVAQQKTDYNPPV